MEHYLIQGAYSLIGRWILEQEINKQFNGYDYGKGYKEKE